MLALVPASTAAGRGSRVPKLSIRNLQKSYGAKVAVSNVDLDVAEGELVVLLGPSGCGKTTTLRCVAGLEDISGGTISIGEETVSAPGQSLPPERRKIGMVFQSYAIWPHMTVAENVAFGPKLMKLPRQDIETRISGALELVGLGSFSGRHVSQLSGGQQQRVALARAMALEPRILLFDEPLSNLDAKLRERMRFELRQIQQRLNITSLYVTHDQQEAMVIADRIILMNGGTIEQIGTPMDLYHRPKTRFAAEFVGLANIYDGESDGTTARVGSHEFTAADPQPRGKVEVVFRPEEVIVSAERPDGPNVLTCKVRECHFLGNATDLILTADGLDVRAQLSPARDFRIGETLWASVPAASVRYLPVGERAAAAA